MINPDMCFIHGKPEPSMPGDYRACFECCHVWCTEAEYRHDIVTLNNEMGWPLTEDDLPFCPLCSHDW